MATKRENQTAAAATAAAAAAAAAVVVVVGVVVGVAVVVTGLGAIGALGPRNPNQKVANVMRVLGLYEHRFAIIGDEKRRGISGGQRKRVNVAMELVGDPSVLFLDEPTTGLDSTTSFELVQALKAIASHRHVNVAAVIHQPSAKIFSAFDDGLLLGSGGATVYLGPSSHALAYFTSLGFEIPPHENPADFFLDAILAKVPSKSPLFSGGTSGDLSSSTDGGGDSIDEGGSSSNRNNNGGDVDGGVGSLRQRRRRRRRKAHGNAGGIYDTMAWHRRANTSIRSSSRVSGRATTHCRRHHRVLLTRRRAAAAAAAEGKKTRNLWLAASSSWAGGTSQPLERRSCLASSSAPGCLWFDASSSTCDLTWNFATSSFSSSSRASSWAHSTVTLCSTTSR